MWAIAAPWFSSDRRDGYWRVRTVMAGPLLPLATRAVTADARVRDMSRLARWSASPIGAGAAPHWPRFPGERAPRGAIASTRQRSRASAGEDPVVAARQDSVGQQPGARGGRGAGSGSPGSTRPVTRARAQWSETTIAIRRIVGCFRMAKARIRAPAGGDLRSGRVCRVRHRGAGDAAAECAGCSAV